jgi:hypothetical protein
MYQTEFNLKINKFCKLAPIGRPNGAREVAKKIRAGVSTYVTSRRLLHLRNFLFLKHFQIKGFHCGHPIDENQVV